MIVYIVKMTQKEIDKIIQKYLRGEASKEEINHIEKLEQFAQNKVRDNIFESQKEKAYVKDTVFKNIQKNIQRKVDYRIWFRVAASVVILISVGIGYYFNHNSPDDIEVIVNNNYITKEATWGQKLKITLPDGSIVNLNSGSKILFPEKFTDSIREVNLEGEAFFDVVKNDNKPFIIISSKLTTTVLGTSFNIEAFPNKTDIKVTLATGKVSIYANGKKTLLAPSEQAIFNKENKEIITKIVDIQKYLEWKDGVLRFENATLREVIPKLEKWFNVIIEFENKSFSKCSFTGTFKNETLQTILESLTYIKEDITYQFVSGNKIILRGKCTD